MICVEKISKRFRLYASPRDRLKELVLRRPCHVAYQALDQISFTVEDRETLGIIGLNGSGKSTLLKVIMGILLPDEGHVSTSGKITGLLELGTGFNHEMTGLENIAMNGLLLGMTPDEIDATREAIVDFSELGDFIREPLKTYSSGMVMRLAFSIAIFARPSCFVVDEALSVGDAHFSQKCMRAIRDFREQGGSIIFVSHDLNAVKLLCDKAILLHGGRIAEMGDPETVVNKYNYLVSLLSDRDNRVRVQQAGKKSSFGTLDLEIIAVEVRGADSGSAMLSSGELAEVAVTFLARKDLPEVTLGILIRDRFGQDIFGTNTFHHRKSFLVRAGARYRGRFRFPMNIGPGKYSVTAALHTEGTRNYECYHWRDGGADFTVAGIRGPFFIGIARQEPHIEIEELSEEDKGVPLP